jgi:hypothetical protein
MQITRPSERIERPSPISCVDGYISRLRDELGAFLAFGRRFHGNDY